MSFVIAGRGAHPTVGSDDEAVRRLRSSNSLARHATGATAKPLNTIYAAMGMQGRKLL